MKPSGDHGSAGPARIRQLNREAVLRHIRLHGHSSRSNLIQALDLSAAAVSSLVNELIEDALLKESDSVFAAGRMGRPVSLLELRADAAFALGVVLRPDANGVRLEAAWADYAGGVELAPTVTIVDAANPSAVVEGICEAIRKLENAVPAPERINSVVIGIPGVVEEDRQIRIAPRLRSIEGRALSDVLRRHIRYPVSFHNDINLAAMAELYQQPRLRALSFAYLFIASGVGASIGLRGQIWAGNGWAGEIGQLRITRSRHRRESFEELLGIDHVLADRLEALSLPRDGYRQLVDAVDRRDRRAMRVVSRYAESLCDLIQVLNAVLDLDEVIVDFPDEALLARLLPRVQTVMADSALKVELSTPSVARAAGVRGAALVALGQSLGTVQRRDRA